MLQEQNHPARRSVFRCVSRRDFLKVGTAALGSVCYLDSAVADSDPVKKSLIHIYLPGGPSHLDTFDMKPHAPANKRGEFRPIRTNTVGVEICEHFPRLARLANRFTVIRAVNGLPDEHSPCPVDSGWSRDSLRDIGGRPGLAAVISALRTRVATTNAPPSSVDLTGWTSPGFLGNHAALFEPAATAKARKERYYRKRTRAKDSSRRKSFSGLVLRQEEFTQNTSPSPLRYPSIALEYSREPVKTLARYGITAHPENARLLQARRLLEAGVKCVSLEWGYWDTHGNNFGQLRNQLPALDQGLSALIQDLEGRGLLNDTLILMSGEFGRTPEINSGVGRDHWEHASWVFLAGGNRSHGQVIGQTDREGAFPRDAIPMQAVIALAYAELGLNVQHIHLRDSLGQRHRLVENDHGLSLRS